MRLAPPSIFPALSGKALFLVPPILLAAIFPVAAAKGPAAGTFGFDWLRPAAARCQEVSEPLLKRFRQCEYQKTGAFGLSDPVYVCRIDDRSEYMIFETRAACTKNLETMKANAP